MTSTLTERYIDAVVRRVPAKQRDDLREELRASLADAIDDRVEAGEKPKDAEYATIAELGDPTVLAAGYADRPLQLIGPELYPSWRTLLTVLELVVVPIVLVVIAIVWLAKGEPIGEAVGASLWISFEVAVQLAFWITVTFAIVERSAGMRSAMIPWSPDMLPDTSTEPTRAGTLWTAGFGAVFIALFIVQWYVSPFSEPDGSPITFLDPWIVQTGLVIVLVAVPLLQIGGSVLQLTGHWNLGWAIAAIAVDVVGALTIIVLGATSHALNPAFVDAAGWPDIVIPIVNWSLIGLGALTILTSAWENIRSVRRV